jgi:hypothetical protein
MSYYLSLDKCIGDTNNYINTSIEHAEEDINKLERNIEAKKTIEKKDYDMFFPQLNQRLNFANNQIAKFTREKSEIIQKVNDHIDHIVKKNEHIKTIADKALVKLNAKYVKNQSLANLSAMTLKSFGVKEEDLPSPVQEVYTRNVSQKGGKKQNRKTKKRQRHQKI